MADVEMTEEEKAKAQGTGVYKSLAELDAMLEKAVVAVEKAFDDIENLEKTKLKYAQAKIDKACEQISNTVNATLHDKKIEAVQVLKAKYQQALNSMAMFKPIIDLLSLNISLDTVVTGLVKTIQAFAAPYVKPYEDAVKFTVDVVTVCTPLINNITNNTNKLLEAPQKAQEKIAKTNPELNIGKLNINFTPPSISDIIG